jgi:hypothetical protein
LFHSTYAAYADASMIRWLSTIWPGNLQPFFALAIKSYDPGWWEANWDLQSYFDALLTPELEFGQLGTLFLVAGLAAKEVGQKTTTIDATILGIAEQRLEASLVAGYLQQLMGEREFLVSRWTKAFGQVAAASTQHAIFVADIIERSLDFDPKDSPRDLGGLIELLYELRIELGQELQHEVARTFFSQSNKGGKLGTFGKLLLAL